MRFTFVSLTLFLYLCNMKNGDNIDFNKIRISLPRNENKLFVGYYFVNSENFHIGPDWDCGIILEENGVVKAVVNNLKGVMSNETFYSNVFYYQGKMMGEYHVNCTCPTSLLPTCERCNEIWIYNENI